ncbi:hypothetical protein BT96DRAFT_435928 [Gymnopus androsaceus JB14]|uniref:Uncharacterized protein n=1 Tax=Gymnopus androsaceus JB14 TaxID=1447944 RepID=A0A6A4GSP5_9AGAR|nr:hypothetical protein BT96DRAFT_435928 [Gymnopus androsaceus JB14]
MTDRYNERLFKYFEGLLDLWFPSNIPQKASNTQMKLVSEGIRIISWEAYGNRGKYCTQKLASVISPFIARIWAWASLMDPKRYAHDIQRNLTLDIIRLVGSFATSPDLCTKMHATPDLIETVAYIWAGRDNSTKFTPDLRLRHFLQSSYGSEIMIHASLTIRRLPSLRSVRDPRPLRSKNSSMLSVAQIISSRCILVTLTRL